MKVLIVKTSSMGDIIHTLPALTEAARHVENIRFDWVVEKPFAEIAQMHPLVDQVIQVQVRKWRKNIFKSLKSDEWKTFRQQIKAQKYDYIIDAQGLLKSAIIARMAKGVHCGFTRGELREKVAGFFYKKQVVTEGERHEIYRIRRLFAEVLGYHIDKSFLDYGLMRQQFSAKSSNHLIFLHGTTWLTKHWPEQRWIELAKLATDAGYNIKLPWGNEKEKARAERIASDNEKVEVLPKLSITEVTRVLASSKAVVSVDTGLGHMAAALNLPTVFLFGPTDPLRVTGLGDKQTFLRDEKFHCSEKCERNKCVLMQNDVTGCFQNLSAQRVFKQIEIIL